MAYTREQKKIAKRIVRIGRRRGEERVKIKAALETGLVESNLRNLNYGDADSRGWRQERASLYKNPNNLKASINRFYDETDQLHTPGESAGSLAGRVQRPASEYLGRYGERAGEAKRLLGRVRGGRMGGGSKSGSTRTTTTTSTPDTGGLKAQAFLQYAADRKSGSGAGAFASYVSQLGQIDATAKQATTESTKTVKTPGKQRDRYKGGGGEGLPQHRDEKNLLELFWQGPGGINVKHGTVQPQGFVDGHTEHVHVAANPKAIVKLGKIAQGMGLSVGENPKFGGVDPVHVSGSFHYSNRAIDVSGDPALMRKFAHRVARLYGIQ